MKLVLLVASLAMLLLKSMATNIHESVIWSEDATCRALGTVLTCRGDGEVTKTMVNDAGVYTKFTEAVIEEGITKLGDHAFGGCLSLKKISLPESLEVIDEYCFEDAALEGEIRIPGATTLLYPTSFNAAMSLTKITIDSTNSVYTSVSGIVYKGNVLFLVPAGLRVIDSYKDGVKELTENSFRWSQVTELDLPSTVKIVGDYTFYYSALEKITIPDGIETFAVNAFMSCTHLTQVTMTGTSSAYFVNSTYFARGTKQTPKGIIWISPTCKELYLSKNITWIGYTVLSGSNVEKVVVEQSSCYKALCNGEVLIRWDKSAWILMTAVGKVKHIDLSTTLERDPVKVAKCAFEGCKLLESVILNHHLTDFEGGNTFRACPKLSRVDFGGSALRKIPSYAFFQSGPIQMTGWGNVTVIDSSAFRETLIEEIDLSHIETVGLHAFRGCQNLRKVTFKNVDTIHDSAFYACPQLSTVVFTASNVNNVVIKSTAFAECSMLTSLAIPASVTSLNPASFAYNPNLTQITFVTEPVNYRSVSGVIYSKDMTEIVICPSGLVTITLLATTTKIGYNAFYGCAQLREVIMPDNIKTISSGAFYDCGKLEMIRLPASVESIGTKAFDSCSRLQKVLFCSSGPAPYMDSDPFPTSPEIWVFYDFQGEFGGHECLKMLDHLCNIPTEHFTVPLSVRGYNSNMVSKTFFLLLTMM